MKKNDLVQFGESILRILEVEDHRVFVIDCVKRTMPKWVDTPMLDRYSDFTEQALQTATNISLCNTETLDGENKRVMHERYTLIAGILPFIADEKQRNSVISKITVERGVSKQIIRKYLCLYLVYQDMSAFAPKQSP